eukprot:GHVR01049459.1.p2 GENE.GHVR01049459.1~~GHVR01049459.1.p2  ORF type:complete len:130 (+),score=30.15 GHVR01049459.1:745-1134(+)
MCSLGYNSMAAYVTRASFEMRRLAVANGASVDTLAGLSGMGDLMLSCFGPLSRNRTVGVRLGKGEKLADILKSMDEVAEGVDSTQVAARIARECNIDCPLLFAIEMILNGKLKICDAPDFLMARPGKDE